MMLKNKGGCGGDDAAVAPVVYWTRSGAIIFCDGVEDMWRTAIGADR